MLAWGLGLKVNYPRVTPTNYGISGISLNHTMGHIIYVKECAS